MNSKVIYGKMLVAMSNLIDLDFAKQFDTLLRFHRKLNLKHPNSLADKVAYIELHKQSPIAPMCTDKVAVREFVKKKGLEEILIPMVGGPWESVEDVNFDALPNSFVLKATHGCKMNYLVPDKANLNLKKCKSELYRWINTTYGTYSMEPHYLSIPHRIYAEEYLSDAIQLTDYKFHCANGKPLFVMTVYNRKVDGDNGMSLNFDVFDMEWNPIEGMLPHKKEIPGDGKSPKPKMFYKMVEIAKILSAEFDFVRVDLYEQNGKVLFGELTFSPDCCVFPNFPQSFLDKMGNKLRITLD